MFDNDKENKTRRVLNSRRASNLPSSPVSPSAPSSTTLVVRRSRKSARFSAIPRAEKLAAISAVRRARTHSPPVTKSGVSWTPPTRRTQKSPLSSEADDVSMDVSMEVEKKPLPVAPSSSGLWFLDVGKLKLPSRLGWPQEKLISKDTLKVVDEDLASVPVDYVRDVLALAGSQMLMRAKHSRIIFPQRSSDIPKELEVIVDNMAGDLPTHILAVVARPLKNSQSTPQEEPKDHNITLHVTHNIILATHCATLPASCLAPKAYRTVAESTNRTMPVIPIALPHPPSFPPLHFFLYTKNTKALITTLIPLPAATIGFKPDGIDLDIPEVAKQLARTYTLAALIDIAAKIHGVWANACCLGVWDRELWMTIEWCWVTVFRAVRHVVALREMPQPQAPS